MIPLPTHVTDPIPGRPDRLEPHQKLQLRNAAHRATKLYPGPVGHLISDELLAVEQFGYRFVNGGRTARLLQHVLTATLPGQDTAA